MKPKHPPEGWQWAIQSPDEVVCERTRSNSERESWRLLTENVEDMRKSDFQADGWEAILLPEKK